MAAALVLVLGSSALAILAVNLHAGAQHGSRPRRACYVAAAATIALVPVTVVVLTGFVAAAMVSQATPQAQYDPLSSWAPTAIVLVATGWVAFLFRAVRCWRAGKHILSPLNESQ